MSESHLPAKTLVADEYVADPEQFAADNKLADRTEEELQSFGEDLGMHMLLMVTLKKNNDIDQEILQRVHRGIADSTTSTPHENNQPERGTQHKKKHWWWYGLLLLLLAGGTAATMGTLVPRQLTIETRLPHSDSWQMTNQVRPGTQLSTHQQDMRVVLHSNQRLTLQPESSLTLPQNKQDTIALTAGSVIIERIGPSEYVHDITMPTGRATVHGSSTLEQAKFRDRLTAKAGAIDWLNNQESLLTFEQGSTYDIALGGVPRQVTALTRSYLPMTIATQEILSDNLLHKAQIKENGQTGPAGSLTSGSMAITETSALQIPFMAPPAYDLRWHLRRTSGTGSLALVIPRMEGIPAIAMIDGWQSTRSGFGLLGGPQDNENQSMVITDQLLPSDTTVTLDVRVRPNLVAIYLNGDLLTWEKSDNLVKPADLLWPRSDHFSNDLNSQAALIPRNDSFTILRLECLVHADGVGANKDMYGVQ